jgi:CRISPR system Cascade subunit CasD
MKHLLFQIAAHAQSWGNEHARQERPTDGHPSKSAVEGMLGAATGMARSDPGHAALAQALGFAVAVLKPGHRFSDYHTVLTPKAGRSFATRREEVEASDYTVETYREYLSDAYFLVVLWQKPEGPGAELEALARALERPAFEIFAGRKACSLSLPPAPLVVDVTTLLEAFRAYRKRLFPPLVPEGAFTCRVHWEEHPSSGLESTGVQSRQDALVDRAKSLFRSRRENQGSATL